MSNYINQIKQLLGESLLKSSDLNQVPSSRDNCVFIDNKNNQIIRVSISKSQQDVENEIELLRYINEKGFPVPKIINRGTIYIDKASYPYIIFELFNHQIFKKINENQLENAAYLLGKLHRITKEYCDNNIYKQDRHLNQALVQLYAKLINTKNYATNKDSLIKDLEWGIDFYNSQDFKKPQMVLHNDYRINNVLFGKSREIVAIIDFDWSLESPFALKDLGHSALEWSYPDGEKLNKKNFEKFINNYWLSDPPIKQVSLPEVWQWSKFSALCDAAHYFLSFPEKTSNKFDSYMYDKYIYLKNNEA